MPTAITPVNNFHPVRAVANGDTRNLASYVLSLQSLANRSVYLPTELDALMLQVVSSLRFTLASYDIVRSGTWTRPKEFFYASTGIMMVTLIGGGGGGGAGNTRANRSTGFKCPGKGGHSGARQTFFLFDGNIPETAEIQLGEGGAGGTSGALIGHPGNAGSAGGRTTFYASASDLLLAATGGIGGAGGHYDSEYVPVPPAALITRSSVRGGRASEWSKPVYDGDPAAFPGGVVGTGLQTLPGGGGAGGWHLPSLSASIKDRIEEMLKSGEVTLGKAAIADQPGLLTAAVTPAAGRATTASRPTTATAAGRTTTTASRPGPATAARQNHDAGGASDDGNGDITRLTTGGLGYGAGGAGGPSIYAGNDSTGGRGAEGAVHISLWYLEPITA